MKLFLRNISVFALLIIAFFALAEAYVRNLPNPARYKHQWMLKHSAQVETLVMGNSHCFYGINPSLLGDYAFSLAQPSQTYRYDYYLLKHYNMPRLSTVVLPFSYTSLFEDIEYEPHLQYWAVRYRLYMDCDIHSRWSRYGMECLNIVPFKEKLTSLWKPSQLKWDSLGFGTSYGTVSLLAEGKDNGAQRAQENTYEGMKSLQFCTSMLDSISTWCDAKNVRLVLVSTPTWGTFRQHCDPRQVEKADSTLHRVLQRHPKVLYYNHWEDSSFVITDFYDADHLNQRGARKLTLMLKNEVEKSLKSPKK